MQILFSEKQRFTQWWVWVFLIGTNGLMAFMLYKQIATGVPAGTNPVSDTALFFICGGMVLFTIFFLSLRLDTEIKEDGIYVRFFPFHLKFRHHGWNQISKCYVRVYKPLMEYGGWGIRGFAQNRALNVSGKKGLQLEFTDGKKLLIGSQKSNELTSVLEKLGQQKS